MLNCVAVFDIGKTYKKLLLFDQTYTLVHQEQTTLPESLDEDGFPCENLAALTRWLRRTWQMLEENPDYNVVGLNFTTYGASLVFLDLGGSPVAPLYNYLKPYPEELEKSFYGAYGDKLEVAAATASPALGMLNAGLQLYRLKHRQPDMFRRVAYALHFPQYLAFLFTGQLASDYTSLGCHTSLWDYQQQEYHDWVCREGLEDLLPPLRAHQKTFTTRFRDHYIPAGLGLHDSSAALIPYLKKFREPFLLLSTGTWGITMNPFARQALTVNDLQRDCLQYLTHDGQPVKASRYFIGHVHEMQVQKLASYFGKPTEFYKTIRFDPGLVEKGHLQEAGPAWLVEAGMTRLLGKWHPAQPEPAAFESFEAGYHYLLTYLIRRQARFIRLAAEGQITGFKTLVVDGGFSRNAVFMALLRQEFPGTDVQAGQTAEGTALGAALLLPV